MAENSPPNRRVEVLNSLWGIPCDPAAVLQVHDRSQIAARLAARPASSRGEAIRAGVEGALKRAGERRAARLAAKTAKARETSERAEAARQAVARAAVAQEVALAEREWRAAENRADILGATVRRAASLGGQTSS